MRERIIIVFIAIAIGLLITTLLFFLYQQTKISPSKNQSIASQPTPEENQKGIPLSIDEPKNNSLSDRRTIQVKGKTDPHNTLVVSTNQEDVVTTPTSDGKFSVSIAIDSGTNEIVTRTIAPNGEDNEDTRVITYSTEEF